MRFSSSFTLMDGDATMYNWLSISCDLSRWITFCHSYARSFIKWMFDFTLLILPVEVLYQSFHDSRIIFCLLQSCFNELCFLLHSFLQSASDKSITNIFNGSIVREFEPFERWRRLLCVYHGILGWFSSHRNFSSSSSVSGWMVSLRCVFDLEVAFLGWLTAAIFCNNRPLLTGSLRWTRHRAVLELKFLSISSFWWLRPGFLVFFLRWLEVQTEHDALLEWIFITKLLKVFERYVSYAFLLLPFCLDQFNYFLFCELEATAGRS